MAGLAVVAAGAAVAPVGDSFDAKILTILALVISPLVCAAAVVEPWAGLMGWLVAMPLLNATRTGVGLGPVQVIPSTVVVACLCVGSLYASRGDGARSGRMRLAGWALPGLVVLLAAASTLAAGDPTTSVPVALNGLVVPTVLAALVIGLRPTRERIVWLLAAMGASVTIASVYNLLRLLRDFTSLGAAQAARTDFARFTYYNVGIFGDMLAMTVPLLLVFVFAWRYDRLTRRAVFLVGAAAALEVVAAYLTFTKSAWIGCLAGSSLTLILVARSWRQRAAVFVVAAIMAAMIVPYPAYALRPVSAAAADGYLTFIATIQGTDRAASWDPRTKEGEVSVNERVLATEAGLRMTRDHPLLGVGPGQFGVEYAQQYKDAQATRPLGSPHNVVVDLTAEYGLPLALLVLAGFAAAFLGGFRAYRRGGPDRLLGAAIVGALAAFLVVGLTFGSDLYRPWRYMDSDVVFAALLLAAGVAGLQPSRSAREATSIVGPRQGAA